MGDRKFSVLSACVAASVVLTGSQALAHGSKHHHSGGTPAAGKSHHHHGVFARLSYRHTIHGGARYAYAYHAAAHVIQCVAFAKQDAGIMIRGNARDWWGRAAGIYERGSRPEPGSVLSFRSIGRMPLGHVAVVSGIEDSRTIVIDQSHWNSRGITRDIEVKDVSENNDWSAVRVQLGHGGAFGSIYPTHGFIYPRPDRNVGSDMVTAERRVATPVLAAAAMNPRVHRASLEVAEMPDSSRGLDLTVPGLSFDSPNRSLR